MLYLFATAASSLLLLIALYAFSQQLDEAVETARLELAGAGYIDRLTEVMSGLQRVRGLNQIALREPGEALAREVASLKVRVSGPLMELERDPLSGTFRVKALLSRLRTDLERQAEDGGAEALEKDFRAYTAMVSLLHQDVIQRVALHSRLLQDPDADTYLLVDLLVNRLPRLVERLGQLRGRFSGFLAEESGDPSPIRVQVALLMAELQELRHHWHVLVESVPEVEDLMWDHLQRAEWSAEALIRQTEAGPPMAPLAYFELGSRAIQSWCAVCDIAVHELQRRLSARMQRLANERTLGTVAAILALAILLAATTLFYRRDRQAMERLAAQHREMELLSRTDPLTGLNNRRPLDELFAGEVRRAARENRGLAFGILDIDYFKRFNDTHGHQAGDDALVAVAGVMRRCLMRAGDHLFRMGGEEFCYLHPVVSVEDSRKVAERLRRAVADLRLPGGSVTVSIGVCCLGGDGEALLDQAIHRADEALYRAKAQGRNRVELCAGTCCNRPAAGDGPASPGPSSMAAHP